MDKGIKGDNFMGYTVGIKGEKSKNKGIKTDNVQGHRGEGGQRLGIQG